MKTVVGLYKDREDAHHAVKKLRKAGFPDEHISLIVRHPGGKPPSNMDGVAVGGEIGGILGGVAGLMLGLGMLTIPSLGPVLAAGPLITTLAGLGAGAIIGSLLGGLVNLSIPKEHAKMYEEGVRMGGVLIAVRAAEANVQEAMDILNNNNPIDVEQRSDTWYETLGLEQEKQAFAQEAVPVTGNTPDHPVDTQDAAAAGVIADQNTEMFDNPGPNNTDTSNQA